MSLIDPPFSAQRKRKRSPLDLPSDSINPLSHSPGTIYQFALAGLSHTDVDPATVIPDFPHRGLDRPFKGRSAEEAEADDAESQDEAKKKIPLKDPFRGGHFDVLLQSTHHFLDQGHIASAARAYALLLQLRPNGAPVDVRHHNLWAIGAEILMREGDDDPQQQPKRWGRAANMHKVKAYFDTLIQQHPYDNKHPRTVSALEFWHAMLSCEIYNAHTEHVLALGRLEWDEEPSYESYGGDEEEEVGEREGRMRQRKDELRLQALEAMRDITRRMDAVMQNLPYSKHAEFLRLRAMASLYVADLVLPLVEVSPSIHEDAQRRRHMEQQAAKNALQKILDNGGELDPAARAILTPHGESDDEDSSIPLYSSLPIRGL